MFKVVLFENGTPDDWGFIPTFLDEDDPRSIREQFDEKYISGWNKFDGFKFDENDLTITYPGDPPLRPLSAMVFRGELILLYPGAWVLTFEDDNDKGYEISRMD